VSENLQDMTIDELVEEFGVTREQVQAVPPSFLAIQKLGERNRQDGYVHRAAAEALSANLAPRAK
jgi:hypothetical protein